MYPSYSFLESLAEQGQLEANFAEPLHPNPRLYKYRWWVFHRASASDGDNFFNAEPSLSIAQAMQLAEDLRNRGEPYALYNQKLPRRPVGGYPAWNELSDHWARSHWAPNFEQDHDPEWKGHK